MPGQLYAGYCGIPVVVCVWTVRGVQHNMHTWSIGVAAARGSYMLVSPEDLYSIPRY